MAASWDEIKRLAADFQRAQLSTTLQRLSERNCIEIVKKLIDLKLIEVIFTNDGKEYVTPQHLVREMQDELYIHGGRINLVDLAQILNVDLSHIEARVGEMVRGDPDLTLVLGQLINRTYMDQMCEEINERLQQNGQVTIAELTKHYDLPGDFLEQVVLDRLGTLIQGQADPYDTRTIFTEAYIAQHKACVRGVLSAVTRPVSVSHLINRFCFPERLFCNVTEELIKEGRLCGTMSGGRSERATYIPDIYAKSQNEWVDNFYKQNGYLEYDSLARLGIQDIKTYLARRFKGNDSTFLSSCFVGPDIFQQVEAAVDEALATGSWIDVSLLLPSVFSEEDAQQIIQKILKQHKQSSAVHTFCDNILVSDSLITECLKSFDTLLTEKAEEESLKGIQLFTSTSEKGGAKSEEGGVPGKTRQDRKEDRRKKAAAVGKSGAGTQGREVRMKAVKKKYKPGKGGDGSDSEGEDRPQTVKAGKASDLCFMSVQEMEEHLGQQSLLQECPEELVNAIAWHVHRPLTRKYQEIAKSIFLASAAASGAARRKTHSELQEKMNVLLTDVRLFQKGLALFTDETQTQLTKHLLRTLCSEMTNAIISYLAVENGVTSEGEVSAASMTPEIRQKLIAKFPASIKEPLTKLHNSLNAKVVEDFFDSIETVLGAGICDMIVHKVDKKKERNASLANKHMLQEELSKASDPALSLHVATLLLFHVQTQNMLHASGKFVPQIISCLYKNHLPDAIFRLLHDCQELVMKQLTLKDEEEKQQVAQKLEELLPKVKEAAASYRRTSVSEVDN